MELCLAQIMRDAADVITGSSFVTSILGSNTRKSGTLRLENRDYQLYEDAYKPDPITAASDRPTAVHGNDAKSIIEEVSDNTVQFRWNSSNIHVAKSFDIRRAVKNSSGTITDWELVASLGSPYNAATKLLPIFIRRGCEHGRVCESVEVTFTATNQPGGTQTYGIFSASDAWKRLTDGFRYGPSTQATVDVPGTKACTLSVTPNPAAGTTGSASTTGLCGSSLMVSAPKAASGYRFTGWSAPCSGTGSCSVTVGTTTGNSQTTPVTANYAPQCTLTVKAGTGGKVKVGSTTTAVDRDTWTGDCGTQLSGTSGANAAPRATAPTSHQFTGWSSSPSSWTGGCSGTGACTPTVGTAGGSPGTYTLTASFAPRYCTVSVRVGTGLGSVSTTPAGGRVQCGVGEVTYTATATAGYCFSGWSPTFGASGQEDCPTSSSPRITPTVDFTFTANFTRLTYVLTTGVSPAGGGSVSDGDTYNSGTTVSVTATPNAGWRFTRWSGDCEGTGACSVTMDGPKSVTAHFTRITYVLTTTPSPANGGSVSGGGRYNSGTTVSVTATPNAGWRFTVWSGDCEGTGACSVTMDGPKSVTARFARITYVLTTTPSPTNGGSVSGGGRYNSGTTVTVTARPNAGWGFTGWLGDCRGTGSCSVLMSGPKSVTATFARLATCYLYGSATAGGSASSDSGLCGSRLSITASPNAVSYFTGWSGDCSGTVPTCTLTVGETGDTTSTIKRGTANFAPLARCRLTARARTGGRVSLGGSSSPASSAVDSDLCGNPLSVTAVPNAGWHFRGWSGVCASETSTTCTRTLGQLRDTSPTNRSVTATFRRNQCTLRVAATPSGTGRVSGGWTGDCGTLRTVTARANTGYQFSRWSGACGLSTSSCAVRVGSATGASRTVTATAHFTTKYCRVRVTVGRGGGGTVSTEPTSGTVQCGTGSVTYKADASGGYCFWDWSGGLGVTGQASCADKGSGTVRNPTTDLTFTAHFRPTLTIEVKTGSDGRQGAGSTSPGAGTYIHTYGTRVTITATGIFGSVWTWGGACSGSGRTCTVTMTEPRSVTVTFSPGGGGGFGEEEGESTATPTPTATVTPTATPTPSPTPTPAP